MATFEKPDLESHERDDELRGISESGVQKAADGVPRVGSQLFGSVHQQCR